MLLITKSRLYKMDKSLILVCPATAAIGRFSFLLLLLDVVITSH